MEIEIIRPLFKAYNLEDVLPLISNYLKVKEYQNQCIYKLILYDESDSGHYDKMDGKYIRLCINYFGIYFTDYEKSMILSSLISYIENLVKTRTVYKHNGVLKHKVLKNGNLPLYCVFGLDRKTFDHLFKSDIPYYDVCATLVKHYYGKKSVFGNYITHQTTKKVKSYKVLKSDPLIKYKYRARLNDVIIHL